MPRPTITEDTLDRLEEIADARAKVPASHLTPEQLITFLLDELEDADARASRLNQRVDKLEKEIERLRDEDESQQFGNGGGSLGSPTGNNRF
jgi:chromosome segregation ATPase